MRTLSLDEGRHEALMREMLHERVEIQLANRADDPLFSAIAVACQRSPTEALMTMAKRFQLYMMLLSSILSTLGLRLIYSSERTLAEAAVLTLYVQAALVMLSAVVNPVLVPTRHVTTELMVCSMAGGLAFRMRGVAHFYSTIG